MAESGKNGRGPSMNVDTKLVRELAKLLSETGLTEIEVQDGERRIKVGRGAAAPAQAALPTFVEPAAAPTPAPAAEAPAAETVYSLAAASSASSYPNAPKPAIVPLAAIAT